MLILDPRCVCYVLGGMEAGIPVSMPLLGEYDFSPDIEPVISQITGKSRMMAIKWLNNPTGAALSYDDLSRIVRMIEERDLLVISDGAYEKSRIDGVRHYRLAGFPRACVNAHSWLILSLKRML